MTLAYNRQVVTQALNEYPLLTGIGVSLGENMHSLDLQQQVSRGAHRSNQPNRYLLGANLPIKSGLVTLACPSQVDWTAAVYFSALRNASRPVKLLYRAAFGEGQGHANDPNICRHSVENSGLPAANVMVQIKYNWSHGHSTPTLVRYCGNMLTAVASRGACLGTCAWGRQWIRLLDTTVRQI